MTAKAANEARERLLGLLAEQHRLGLNGGGEERYVAVSVEILKLAKTANLDPVLLAPPPPPPPRPPAIDYTNWTPEDFARAEAHLVKIETEKRDYWLDHSRSLRATIDLARRMSAP